MDELVTVALEEVALEGRQGCSPSHLWMVLEQKLPVSSITHLVPEIKHYVWACLIRRTEDVQLFTVSQDTAQQAARTALAAKGKKAKKLPEPQEEKVFVDACAVGTHEEADASGVRLLASDAVRNSVLGLYDAMASRFSLSETQLTSLEEVARKRTLGVLQSNLAPQMNKTNSTFFYVVKSLEERGLIQRTPVMVHNPRSIAACLTTNVLHLQRFAPAVRLGPYQVFKMVELPGNNQQLDLDTATYTIQDDARMLRQICERIASTPDKTVIETELKVVLGFTKTKGHRNWRRLKNKLIKGGQIEAFVHDVNGRASVCIRLLKDFKVPEEGEEGEEAGEQEAGGAGMLLAEVSIERQLLEAILEAGEEGVLNSTLFSQVGLNRRRCTPLLSELVKRYGLGVTVVTVGKAIHNRIQAPPCLLEQFRRNRRMLTGDQAPPEPAPPPALQPIGAGGAVQLGFPTPQAAETVPSRAMRPQRVTTDLADDRLRRLLHRMDTQGWVVSYEMRSMLYHYEVQHGLVQPSISTWQKGPDKKTLNRLTDRMEASGRAKQITITIPGSYHSGELRTMPVMVPVGFEITEESVRPIQEYFVNMERRIRSNATKRYYDAMQQHVAGAGEEVTEAGGAQGQAQQQQQPPAEPGQAGPSGAHVPQAVGPAYPHAEAATNAQPAGPGAPAVQAGGRAAAGEIAGTGGVRPGGLAGLRPPARQRLGSLSQPIRSGLSQPISSLLPQGINLRALRKEIGEQHGQHTANSQVGSLSLKQLFGNNSQQLSLRNLNQMVKPFGRSAQAFPDGMAVLMNQSYQGEATGSRLMLNGFNGAKLINARMLHYLICRCVGLGGFTPAAPAPGGPPTVQSAVSLTDTALNGPLLRGAMQAYSPVLEAKPLLLADPGTGGAGGEEFILTGRQLWRAIPLSLALQIVGVNVDEPGLQRLVRQHSTLADLPQELHDRLFDRNSHRRFAKILDLLQRMQLLEVTSLRVAPDPELPGQPTQHVTMYRVSKTGSLDKPPQAPPAAEPEQEGGAGGYERPAKRAAGPDRGTTPGPEGEAGTEDAGAEQGSQAEEASGRGSAGKGRGRGRGRGRGSRGGRKGSRAPSEAPGEEGEAAAAQAATPGAEGDEAGAAMEGAEGGQRGRGRGRGRGGGRKGRPSREMLIAAAAEAAAAAAAAATGGDGDSPPVAVPAEPTRITCDLATAAGLDEYWQQLEATFGHASSSNYVLVNCFPATVAPEVLSQTAWHGLRSSVGSLRWLQLAEAAQQLVNGRQELEVQHLEEMTLNLQVPRAAVNRVVQELLRRKLSAAGIRKGTAKHLRAATGTRRPVLPRRPPGRPRVKPTAPDDQRKRDREALRAQREAAREARRATREAAARVRLEARAARTQAQQQQVLRQLNAVQQDLAQARLLLEQLSCAPISESAPWVETEGMAAVLAAQQRATQLRQAGVQVAQAESKQGMLRRELDKLSMQLLQHLAAKNAPSARDAERGGPRRVRRRRSGAKGTSGTGTGAESAGSPSATDFSSDDGATSEEGEEDKEGSDAEGQAEVDAAPVGRGAAGLAGQEEEGEEEGGAADGGVALDLLAAPPKRRRRPRHFFTHSDDRALLGSWVRLRVDKGMDYAVVKGRLPWMEMQGLPATQKACYTRLSKLNKRYPSDINKIVAAIRVAHDRLQAARSEDLMALSTDPNAAPSEPKVLQQLINEVMEGPVEALIVQLPPPPPVSSTTPGASPRPATSSAALVPVLAPQKVASRRQPAPTMGLPASGLAGVVSSGVLTPAGLAAAAAAAMNRPAPELPPAASAPVAAGLTPGAVCAMQLICSLMVGQTWHLPGAVDRAGLVASLASRFTEPELKAAVNTLRAGKWLSGAGGKATSLYQLSPQFLASLEGTNDVKRNRALVAGAALFASQLATCLTPPAPQQAGAAAAAGAGPQLHADQPLLMLQEQLQELCPALHACQPGHSTAPTAPLELHASSPDSEVPSELLLVLLPSIAAGSMQLEPQPSLLPPPAPLGTPAPRSVPACDLTLTPGDVPAALTAPTRPRRHAHHTLPGATHDPRTTHQLAKAIHAEPTFLVGLPPHLCAPLPNLTPYSVGQQQELRTSAETTCAAHMRQLICHVMHVAAGNSGMDVDSAASEAQQAEAVHVMQAALAVVRVVGNVGVTMGALQQAVEAAAGEATCRLASGLSLAELSVAALLRACLVRAVAGFDDTRLVAVESSQQLVAPLTEAQAKAATWCWRSEVQLASWHDAHGAVNRPYLAALVQRALLAVERTPGATEDALIAALLVVNPTHARMLLRAMCEQGLLGLRMAPAEPTGARPSLLAGCRKVAGKSGASSRHYMPLLLACMSAVAQELQMPGTPVDSPSAS